MIHKQNMTLLTNYEIESNYGYRDSQVVLVCSYKQNFAVRRKLVPFYLIICEKVHVLMLITMMIK